MRRFGTGWTWYGIIPWALLLILFSLFAGKGWWDFKLENKSPALACVPVALVGLWLFTFWNSLTWFGLALSAVVIVWFTKVGYDKL